ncbi:hypothetical protein [Cryobacterium sp. LW097]|uniref:hypothetical protein n=1 Tax=Cryobacterium sp. LW097 TaxID=1978566 RepID=UPI001243FA18|nr:hypothetical protein [Cryobacterium sp. LW097]
MTSDDWRSLLSGFVLPLVSILLGAGAAWYTVRKNAEMDKTRSAIDASRVSLEASRLTHDTKTADRDVKLPIYLGLLDSVAKAAKQAADQVEANRAAGLTSFSIYYVDYNSAAGRVRLLVRDENRERLNEILYAFHTSHYETTLATSINLSDLLSLDLLGKSIGQRDERSNEANDSGIASEEAHHSLVGES